MPGTRVTTSWPAALLLAAGGLVIGLTAVVGAVSADVPAAAGVATVAAFVAVLPGIVAVPLALVRPLTGAAVTAGAGVLGFARLLADLFVVLQPESVARPELFYPRDGRAYPVSFSPGSLLLIAGDLLMIVAGVIAARAVSAAVRDRVEDLGPGNPESPESSPTKNLPMLAVGFGAVAVLGFGAAQLPYEGGYIEARRSLPGTDLGSVLAPFLLVMICLGAVLLAGTLPRALSTGLLAGTAVAVAVPTLTAVAADVAGAPVSLAAPIFLVPVGALVLVAVGLLTRVRWSDDPSGQDAVEAPDRDDRDDVIDVPRPSEPLGTTSALLAVVAGVLASVASVSPILHLNGAALPADGVAVQVPVDGVPALTRGALGWPFLLAGVLVLVAGLVGALGRLGRFTGRDLRGAARAGKAASGVIWVLPVVAPAAPFLALQSFGRSADEAQAFVDRGIIAPESVDRWTAGPGLLIGVLAGLVVTVAAVLAGVALRREQQEDLTVDDDDATDAARTTRATLGLVALIAGVVTLAVPTFRVGSEAGPAFFSLAGDSWTVWLTFAGLLVAALAGAFARYATVACAALVAAAVLLATRMWPASDVSAAQGYRAGSGAVVGGVCIAVVLACAVLTAIVVRRVRRAPAALVAASHG